MIFSTKRVRYIHWLFSAFIRKNFSSIIISFVGGFIIILFSISIFPQIKTIVFHDREIVGIVGRYTISTIPDTVLNIISNPLVSITSAGDITPVICTSWELSDDKKTYRFHLRQDIVWSDGAPLVAEDIVFRAQGVTTKVIDDHTIEFILDSPLMIFPVYLTKPLIKESLHGIAGVYSVNSYKTDGRNLLTSVLLTPQKTGLPLKEFRFYKSEEDLITAYKKGQITTFDTYKSSVSSYFSSWNNTTVDERIDYRRVMTLFFNHNTPLMQEREVRKAIVYATVPFTSRGETALGPIPPTSWAYYQNVKHYAYNMERAKSTFEDAIESTISAKLTLHTYFDYADHADILQDLYNEAGFDVNVKLLSYIPDEYDLLLTMWEPPIDPDQYFIWHSTQKATNKSNYSNVRMDKILEDGRNIMNLQQRKSYYRDFQKLVAEDIPAHFLYYPKVYTVKRK